MTTKKPASSCKVSLGPKPSRKVYDALRAKFNPIARKSAKAAQMRAASVTPVPDPKPPHVMPVYGGPCWQQCYREAQAYMKAAQKTLELRQALYEYDVRWDATAACLNGYPA